MFTPKYYVLHDHFALFWSVTGKVLALFVSTVFFGYGTYAIFSGTIRFSDPAAGIIAFVMTLIMAGFLCWYVFEIPRLIEDFRQQRMRQSLPRRRL